MTNRQIIEVCEKYKSKLKAEPRRENEVAGSLNHLVWMCDQIIEFVETRHLEKAHRWLGFVQGSMWVLKLDTISSMRDDNRSREADNKGPLAHIQV